MLFLPSPCDVVAAGGRGELITVALSMRLPSGADYGAASVLFTVLVLYCRTVTTLLWRGFIGPGGA